MILEISRGQALFLLCGLNLTLDLENLHHFGNVFAK